MTRSGYTRPVAYSNSAIRPINAPALGSTTARIDPHRLCISPEAIRASATAVWSFIA